MFSKHPLLLTCVVIAATSIARSQATPAPDATPAMLFSKPAAAPAADPMVPQARKPKKDTDTPFVLDVPKPAASTTTGNAADHPAEIDLSALRYFAAQNDLERVAAEIRLLRSKNPDWDPPEDLFSEVRSGIDEQPLWDLFAKRDLVAVHAKIDAIKQDKPDWQPSNNFVGKLALAEAHEALVKASDAQQWGQVIDTASNTKMLLTCGDIDALWRTAEALVHTGEEPRALEAYRYILTTCKPTDQRVATVEKASILLKSPEDLDGLLQMGQRLPDGHNEFEHIRFDLLRRKIGEAAAGTSPILPTQAEIDALSTSAAGPTGQADAQLLGWYSYSRKDYPGAEKWFRTALKAGDNAKAAEGLVLVLRDSGNKDEAAAQAIHYAGLDPLNRKLMVEVQAARLTDPQAHPLSADETTALAKAVDELKSADGAQALGWNLYKANDVAGAEAWFRKSADWKPNESAAIGLVVMARRLRHDGDYAARVAQYRATYPRVAELEALLRSRPVASRTRVAASSWKGNRAARFASVRQRPAGEPWDKSADDIVKAYEGGQYDTAVAMLEQRRQKKSEPQGLAVIRGWAMYHKGDWEGAKKVFTSLDPNSVTRERQEGLRVIQEGYTNPRYR